MGHSGPNCASVATSNHTSRCRIIIQAGFLQFSNSKSCLPSPASPSPPASPWQLLAACAPPPCRLPSCSPPPPPSLTLTLLPSSSEPALPPSVLLGPELELAPSLAPSSSDTPGTPP